MADGGEAAAPDWAQRLAAVCAHLEEIRADLREGPGGDEGPVERVLAAARDGGDIAGTLAVLHAVLQAGGDLLGLDGYTDHTGATRGLGGDSVTTFHNHVSGSATHFSDEVTTPISHTPPGPLHDPDDDWPRETPEP